MSYTKKRSIVYRQGPKELAEAYGWMNKTDVPWLMLTVQQVATLLNVNKATIKRIPYSKLSYFVVSARGDRRYLMGEVMKYVGLATDQALDKVRANETK